VRRGIVEPDARCGLGLWLVSKGSFHSFYRRGKEGEGMSRNFRRLGNNVMLAACCLRSPRSDQQKTSDQCARKSFRKDKSQWKGRTEKARRSTLTRSGKVNLSGVWSRHRNVLQKLGEKKIRESWKKREVLRETPDGWPQSWCLKEKQRKGKQIKNIACSSSR